MPRVHTRIRTWDLFHVKEALCQLSYTDPYPEQESNLQSPRS